MKKVIVVESAAKTKTIRRFLGGEYDVIACGGHIVDLPDDELGINVEQGFKARWEPIHFRGADKVKRVRKRLADADEIYLATDPDREGEAIAADLREHCTPYGAEVKRIEFNAIVYRAVREALEAPRQIDSNRVEAQRARRVLDRMIGFVISSITQFDPDGPGLPSAGRVLCPAVALVVDREREIEAFTPRHYWKLYALLEAGGEEVEAIVDGEWEEFEKIKSQVKELNQLGSMKVNSVDLEPQSKQNPRPPYTTDALQEAADELLNFPPEKTMSLAQELYQGVEIDGKPQALITYMRTDSTRVSPQALNQAKEALGNFYSQDLYNGRPWRPAGGEQDAHEAIRPTSPEDPDLHPEVLEEQIGADLWQLYRLIYYRFLASQSKPAVYKTTEIKLSAGDVTAEALGNELLSSGFLKIYREIRPNYGREEVELPQIEAGVELDLKRSWPESMQTYPPARYREGGLVRSLKEKGIGRPSTYGDILGKIKRGRGGFGYVRKQGGKLRPTDKGERLCDYLREEYEQVISYEYTSGMEKELDRIERSESSYREFLETEFQWLREPYEKSSEKGWLSGDRPTPAQVKFLKQLEKRVDREVPSEVFESKEKTSEWIDRLQEEEKPLVKITEIDEVDVSGVNCYRFELRFNKRLPEEEREYLKTNKMKYSPGSVDRFPGFRFQRQDYETVKKFREELIERYNSKDSPLEARLKVE